MARWECYRCSYVFEGDSTPEECPNCHYSVTFWLERAEDSKALTVRSFVKTDFLTIDGNQSAWDGAKAMRTKGVGNIVVTIAGQPVGIVTERDMLNRVAAEDLPASRVLIRKIMSSPPITITADDTLTEAIKLMSKNHIRTLFVTDKGSVIGLLNMRAIVGDQFKVARSILSESQV